MNVLFPIETLSREFDYKLILAYNLAADFPDLNVYVGSVPAIHNNHKGFENGIYFGKTIFTNADNDKWITRFRERGFNFVFLHEEGAVWFGDEDDWKEYHLNMYKSEFFDSSDVVCVWGETQKKFEDERNSSGYKVQVTGTPRFELGSKYAYLSDKNVSSLRKRFGDFILINGTYGVVNHGNGFWNMFHYFNRGGRTFDETLEYHMSRLVSSSERMYRMIHLILLAANKFPKLNFVFRPHPSERTEAYDQFFSKVGNVFIEREGAVLDYILASKGLIHDGSTTSLDAARTGRPILNFKPVKDEYDLYLPNQIGKTVSSISEAIAFIEKDMLEGGGAEQKEYPLKASNVLYNLTNHDAFDKCYSVIATSIEERKKSLGSIESVAPSPTKLAMESFKRNLKIKLAIIKNSVIRNEGKVKRDKYLLGKFNGIDKSSFREKLSLLNERSDRKVLGTYISKDIVLLRKG